MLLLSVTAAAPSEKDAHTKAHVFAYAQETLHSIIAENAVVVFSRARCSGSARIKTYLEDAGIPYYALELDQRHDGPALEKALAVEVGSKKTPAVYIRGQHVGTTDVGRAYHSGELSHWTVESAGGAQDAPS